MSDSTWTFWYTHESASIHFVNDELAVWMVQRAIMVYDLVNKKGYAVVFSEASKTFEGQMRPIAIVDNQVFAPNHLQWVWMNEDDKQATVDLLRKAISYRADSLPQIYDRLWKHGVEQVKYLLIQKAGEKRYPLE